MARAFTPRLGLLVVIAVFIAACGGGSGRSSRDADDTSLQKATGEPIRIGIITAKSGAQAGLVAVNEQILGGAEAYVSWLNDHGGINGRPLELVVYDDQADPNRSLAGAKFLLEEQRVPMLMYCTNLCVQTVVPYLKDQKIPMTAVAAPLLPLFQPVNPYLFGLLPPYEYQGAALADFLVKEKGLKRIAYAGYDDPSGQSFGSTLLSRTRQLGGEVVLEDGFKRGETDFSAIARKLASAKPDAVVFFSSPTESASVLKAAQAIGLKTTWAFGPGSTDLSLVELAGPLVEGAYSVTAFASVESNSDAVTQFRDIMKRYKPDVLLSPWSQFGYLAARATADALKATEGEITAASIQRALEQLKGDYGMIPPFQVRPDNHLLNTSIQIVQFKGGKLVPASDFIDGRTAAGS